MTDVNETIGDLIDNADVSIIGSVDDEGHPNSKAKIKFICTGGFFI
jgi:hypothetical protein